MKKIFTVLMLAACVVAVSARELHADLSKATKAGTNATWDASTRTFSWTAASDARLLITDIINASENDLTYWNKLVLVTSSYTASYRIDIEFQDNSVLAGTNAWGKFYTAGTKELVLSTGLSASQINQVKNIRINTNSSSGSIVIEDIYLKNDEQAAAGTMVCAGFTNVGNANCSYDANTNVYSWTGGTNNTMRIFSLEAGELARYATLTFTISDYTTGPCRIIFMNANGDNLGEPKFYSNGTKTITIADESSSKLTEEEIAAVTQIRFAGASSEGSVKIVPSSISLNKSAETLSITTDANGYATFSSSYKLDLANLPEGLEAFTATLTGDLLSFSAKTDAVPGATGMLLKGTASTTYEIPTYVGAPVDATNALLANVNEQTLMSDASTYFFAMVKKESADGELTFAKLPETPGMTVPANKAYVAVPATAFSGAPALRVSFGENNTTSFDNLSAEGEAVKFIENGQLRIRRDGIIYDAMGRIVK